VWCVDVVFILYGELARGESNLKALLMRDQLELKQQVRVFECALQIPFQTPLSKRKVHFSIQI
jgi:hypothetical protein